LLQVGQVHKLALGAAASWLSPTGVPMTTRGE
jgi:hypothetical protein